MNQSAFDPKQQAPGSMEREFDLDWLKTLPGVKVHNCDDGSKIYSLPAETRLTFLGQDLTEEDQDIPVHDNRFCPCDCARLEHQPIAFWVTLISLVLIFALAVLNGTLDKDCKVGGTADTVDTGNIKQNTNGDDRSASPPYFVAPMIRGAGFDLFPVLMISQLSNTNKRGAKGGPLDYVLTNSIYGKEQGKCKNYKPTKHQKLVPLIHDHFANHFKHLQSPLVAHSSVYLIRGNQPKVTNHGMQHSMVVQS